MRADISSGADNSAPHLVTSAGSQASTSGMILIVSKIPDIESKWHVHCSYLFAYHESCNKRVHKNEAVNNERITDMNLEQKKGVEKQEDEYACNESGTIQWL